MKVSSLQRLYILYLELDQSDPSDPSSVCSSPWFIGGSVHSFRGWDAVITSSSNCGLEWVTRAIGTLSSWVGRVTHADVWLAQAVPAMAH